MATTIKVGAELRDRINRDAHERGVTAAGLIAACKDLGIAYVKGS